MDATSSWIPTIDLSPLLAGDADGRAAVARAIDAACTGTGFFMVTNHGVPLGLIEETRRVAVEFFALPDDEKRLVERPPSKISRGWFRIGDRSIAYSLGEVMPPDLQEAFAIGPETPRRDPGAPDNAMLAPNMWPARPARMREVLLAYRAAMCALGERVLGAMALALGTGPDFFPAKFDNQPSTVRLIRYPALAAPPLPGQLRSGAHSDYGTLTFVRGDDTPGGLQVSVDGQWLDVHPPPDCFVCNIGDLMARWTNDRWRSTLHRVAVPPPEAIPSDRISLVFFQIPNHDARIEVIGSAMAPGEVPRHAPITCAEHYLGKLMKASHRNLAATAGDATA